MEKSESGGAALQAGTDPRMKGLGSPDGTPGGGAGVDRSGPPPEKCKYCKEMHWHAHCPVRKKLMEERQNQKAAKKEKKKVAKAAKLAAAAATAAAQAASDAKATPGGATPGAGAVAARGATLGDTTPPSATVQSGELLVSNIFMEEGAQTVSLAAGAGLVVLRGSDGQDIAAEPAPASSDDSSSSGSSVYSSVDDPLASASDDSNSDSDTGSMPSLAEGSQDPSSESEPDVASHAGFKGWARPTPPTSFGAVFGPICAP